MGAMISFRQLVVAIGEELEDEYDAAVAARESDTDDLLRLGKVQPVYLRGEVDIQKVNIAYRRSGAGAGGALEVAFRRRPEKPDAVVIEWTVAAPKWQDAEDMNAKIVDALIANPRALAHPEAFLSGAVDDVVELSGQDVALYVVTQSALLVDGNW